MSGQPVARIPELDGVRGIAILMVLLFHIVAPRLPEGTLRTIVEGGWMGVDLFFVLSGFLITGILLDSQGTGGYIRKFYARRVFRILPIYYLFVILLFHVAPLIMHLTGRSPLYGLSGEKAYWVYLSNWQPAYQQNRMIRHFWSLSIEEQFYLVWPWVVAAVPRPKLKYVCATVVVLSPLLRLVSGNLGVSSAMLYRGTPFRLEGLALGALLALASRDPGVNAGIKRWLPAAWLLGGALTVGAFFAGGSYFQSPPMGQYGYTGIALLCFAAVFVVLETRGSDATIASALRMKWITTVGFYSYGLYVWHMPIAEQLGNLDRRFALAGLSHGSSAVLSCGFGLAASAVAAALSWRFIEGPCERIRHKF